MINSRIILVTLLLVFTVVSSFIISGCVGEEGKETTTENLTLTPSTTELGAPLYESSQKKEDSTANWEVEKDGESFNCSGDIYTVSDSFDKVVSFYKDKLGQENYSLQQKEEQGAKVAVFLITKDTAEAKANISIYLKENKTDNSVEISIAQVK